MNIDLWLMIATESLQNLSISYVNIYSSSGIHCERICKFIIIFFTNQILPSDFSYFIPPRSSVKYLLCFIA